MKKILFLIFVFAAMLFAGQDESGGILNEKLRLTGVVFTDNQNLFHSGLLLDFKQDTLFILINNTERAIAINDLKRIEFLKTPSKNYAMAGFAAGLYLGHLLLFTDSKTDGNFRIKEESPLSYIANLAMGAALGGIGELLSTENEKTVFLLMGDIEREKEKLRKFLTGKRSANTINIIIQVGDINTKFYGLLNKQYYYSYYMENTSEFNLLRKFQANYIINDFMQAGVALCNITEPSIIWSNYSGTDYYEGKQSLAGIGYYAAIEVEPIKNLLPEIVLFSTGVLGGFMDLEYHSELKTNNPYTNIIRSSSINKKLVSWDVYSSIGIRVNETLNLSFTADYLHVPEKTSPVPELGIDTESFSTYSFGFSLGFLF